MTERVYIFWGLLPLLVALGSSALGGSWNRVDRVFVGTSPLLEFLLLGFAPPIAMSPVAAAAATIVISVALWVLYLAVSRPPAARTIGLAWSIGLIDGAGLAAIYLSLSWAWGTIPYSVLLVLSCAAVILVVSRLRRSPASPA